MKLMNINLLVVIRLTQLAAPKLTDSIGCVINASSVDGSVAMGLKCFHYAVYQFIMFCHTLILRGFILPRALEWLLRIRYYNLFNQRTENAIYYLLGEFALSVTPEMIWNDSTFLNM